MNEKQTRRSFLSQTTKAGAALAFYGAAGAFTRAESPNNRMRIAVMGCQRGLDLIRSGLKIPNTELVYICEVDKERMARGIQTAGFVWRRWAAGLRVAHWGSCARFSSRLARARDLGFRSGVAGTDALAVRLRGLGAAPGR